MEKGTVIIGIDPDNLESGVGAVFDDKKFLAYKMNFPSLIDYLKAMNESCKKIKVVIEGGWLNKSNWHVLNRFMTVVNAAAIGRSMRPRHAAAARWLSARPVPRQPAPPPCTSGPARPR